MTVTLDSLRHFAVSRTLFAPTNLSNAIERLGFVQADPIRAPARAQDLILRHRVKGYRAGDLERQYATLEIEEDFFVNYGFLPRITQALMHPRAPRAALSKVQNARAHEVLQYVLERGVVHPREVDAHFAHGRVRNWFGGSSNASTQLLDAMHFRGLLRVAGRVGGVRTYAVAHHLESNPTDPSDAMDALVDVILNKYAPLPEPSLRQLIGMLRGGAPQWQSLRAAAFARAKTRVPSALVNGIAWYWPRGESPQHQRRSTANIEPVRFLAPFDPLVWDRRRFEILWGWIYRFEAYTPARKRIRGYYALPLLWRNHVIGWANLAIKEGMLHSEIGYVAGRAPRERAFRSALQDELELVQRFLSLDSPRNFR
jgi:uncharacterized protein